MDADRNARIDRLFEQALDQPDEGRAQWLADQCGGDDALRAELELLLELTGGDVEDALGQVREFASEAVEEPEDGIGIGDRLGAYTVVGRLGRGGMGIVWLGERTDDVFEKRVAIKVLPSARSTPEAVRRFEQERRILARLTHPHIAHLIDGGVDRRGLPFLVMEHVEGEPIDAYCDRRRLPVEERLRLVIEVATALQAAHANLVVHRDLKPSNLLVTRLGDVKLLDFGIAKLIEPESRDPGLTATDGLPMTPTYASPEQVTGTPVTTASDVYQLGLLIYELVTGCRPQAARTSSLADLVDLVCRQEPEPPSRAVLADVAAGSAAERAARRGATPAQLARRARPDLDAIVARALAKEPERRYATAHELAEDLRRWLDGRPIRARRATVGYRLARWIRRNPMVASTVAVAALLTVGYAVAVTFQARTLELERRRAESEAAKAAEVERFVLGLFESSDPEVSLGREATARELLARGTERVERELAGQPGVQARLWSALGEIHGQLGQLESGRDLLGRALARQRELYGERHPEVADTLRRLGALERQSGEWAAAEQTLARAVAIYREIVPPDSPALARGLADLGIVEHERGRLELAEAHFRESLEIHRRRGARGGIAVGLNNLAALLSDRGDFAGAERLYREALAINREVHGPRHPRVALNLSNLGFALRHQGRQAEALAPVEEALGILREVYGSRHVLVARQLLVLAVAEQQLGDLAGAESRYREALPILIERLPPDSSLVADARIGLGQLRVRQGRHTEAQALLEEGLAARRAALGPDHYRVGIALLWLGRSLAGQGRTKEAIAAWRACEPLLRPQADSEALAELRDELRRALPAAPRAGAGS